MIQSQISNTLPRGSIIDSDVWKIPGANGTFRSNKLYKLLRPYSTAPEPFQWIWRSCVLPKQKFFFWLLIQDRLNTRDLLTRKQFQIPSKHCVFCDHSHTEDLHHLFFGCQFSKEFWNLLGFQWEQIEDHMRLMCQGSTKYRSPCFKEIGRAHV